MSKKSSLMKDLAYIGWYTAFSLLLTSTVMLVISTFNTISNPTMIDFWKSMFATTFTTVVTVPIAKERL